MPPQVQQVSVADRGLSTRKKPEARKKIEFDTNIRLDRLIKDDKLQLAITRSLAVTKRNESGQTETKRTKKITEVERDLKALKQGQIYQQITQQGDSNLATTAREAETDFLTVERQTLPAITLSQFFVEDANDANGQEKTTELITNYRSASGDLDLTFQAKPLTSSDSQPESDLNDYPYFEKLAHNILNEKSAAVDAALTQAKGKVADYEDVGRLSLPQDWGLIARQSLSSSNKHADHYLAEPAAATPLTSQLEQSAGAEKIPTTKLDDILSQDYVTGDNNALILNYDLNSPDNDSQIETRLLYKNQEQNQSLFASLESTEVDFDVNYSQEFDAMYVTEIGGAKEKDGRFIEFYKNGDIIQNSIDREEVETGDLIEARLSEEQRCYNAELKPQESSKAPNNLEELNISPELAFRGNGLRSNYLYSSQPQSL